MNPTPDSLAREVTWFTGYTLPDSAKIVYARRERPSPLLGDYSSCAVITLEGSDFREFVKTAITTERPNLELGCPEHELYERALTGFSFKFHAYADIDPDEWYYVKLDEKQNTVFIAMAMM